MSLPEGESTVAARERKSGCLEGTCWRASSRDMTPRETHVLKRINLKVNQVDYTELAQVLYIRFIKT